jgi:hypothetical protein
VSAKGTPAFQDSMATGKGEIEVSPAQRYSGSGIWDPCFGPQRNLAWAESYTARYLGPDTARLTVRLYYFIKPCFNFSAYILLFIIYLAIPLPLIALYINGVRARVTLRHTYI